MGQNKISDKVFDLFTLFIKEIEINFEH